MARTVIDILEELESTSGKLAKIDVMEAARKNELLKRVFVAAQDPYTVYYVTKFKMPAPAKGRRPESSDAVVETFLNGLSRFSSRELTGNAAKERVIADFADMTELEQKWCLRILLKNLRAGVQDSVNKVWPDLIKGFEVALAKTLKSEFIKGEGIKILEPVKYPVRVEPKLDGLRLIAIKRNGKVTLFTRNGTELTSLPRIRAALEEMKLDNIVLDGEGMAADWNESSSIMMSGRAHKEHQKDDSNMYYNVFDAMPFADWSKQETELTYTERVKLVHEVVLATVEFEQGKSSPVRQVPHIMAKNEAELKAYFSKCMDEGYEGVMLKTMSTTYEWKRSKNILKLKPVVTYEGVIIGSYQGRKNTKREGQFGGFYVLLPNQVITRVGGGFNDALRAEIQADGPETWDGKIAECEAQPDPLTADGLTKDGKMRFPVYCRIRNAADVDKSVPATWKWWHGLKAADQIERLNAVNRDKNNQE